MHRSILVLFVTASLSAAPVPKSAGKGLVYFPTTVGTKWESEKTAGTKKTAITETVSKVEEKDGALRVTVERQEGESGKTSLVRAVSEKGVSIVARGAKVLTDPVQELKLPAQKGEQWTADVSSTNPDKPEKITAVFTIGDVEEIQVPAGKYSAIKVTAQIAPVHARSSLLTAWFAPGVGMVKYTHTVADKVMEAIVLKSFTPGK